MVKDSITFEPRGITVEVKLRLISRAIGEQFIMNTSVEDHEQMYLAALAMETFENDDYDTTDTLMEFIRNNRGHEHLSSEDCDAIEELLR